MSMRFNQPVVSLVLSKLPVTFQLATMALVIAIVLGVTAGIVAAVYAGTAIDQTLTVLSVFGFSIPNFWLGILLIMVVSVQWGLLPASGYVSPFVDPWQSFRTMLMPAFVLGSHLAAVLMRHTRSAMIEALNTDYVRTALAKGMPRRRIILKPCAPQCAGAGGHARRARVRPAPRRLGADRVRLLGARHRQAARRFGLSTATTRWCRRWCSAPARSTSPSISSPTSPTSSSTRASGTEPAHERARRDASPSMTGC